MALSASAACAVLGVPAGSTFETARHAYRQQLLHAHPDKGGDPEVFHSIRRAWQFFATRHGLAQRRAKLSQASGSSSAPAQKRQFCGTRIRQRPCIPKAAVQQGPALEKRLAEDSAKGSAQPRLQSVRLSTLFGGAEPAQENETQHLSTAFKSFSSSHKRSRGGDLMEAWRATALSAAGARPASHAKADAAEPRPAAPATASAPLSRSPLPAIPAERVKRKSQMQAVPRKKARKVLFKGPGADAASAHPGSPPVLTEKALRAHLAVQGRKREIASNWTTGQNQWRHQVLTSPQADTSPCAMVGTKELAGPEPRTVSEVSDTPAPSELNGLAARLRAVTSPTERRKLIVSLPEVTRRALQQHMERREFKVVTSPCPTSASLPQEPQEPPVASALHVQPGSSPAQASSLPPGPGDAALVSTPSSVTTKIKAGPEGPDGNIGVRLKRILCAPDIAAVAAELREVDRVNRRELIKALPDGMQMALQEHMLKERRIAAIPR